MDKLIAGVSVLGLTVFAMLIVIKILIQLLPVIVFLGSVVLGVHVLGVLFDRWGRYPGAGRRTVQEQREIQKPRKVQHDPENLDWDTASVFTGDDQYHEDE